MKKYNAIIIGSGQAGNPLARRLGKAGWKTLIVEQAFAGGTCINYGCTPTKTMIASARMAWQAGRAGDYGVNIKGISIDLKAIIARKNKVVMQFRQGSEKSLESVKNIDLLYGAATFIGKKQVAIKLNRGGTKEFEAEHIFINTGTRTAIPAIPGLADVDYLTSTTIMDITKIPKHLVIIGGSYIALEFGQMFRRFGSEVTILEGNPVFLSKEDRDVADTMMQILQEDGMKIHTGVKVTGVAKKDKALTVTATINNRTHHIEGTHLLLAAGRLPNTGDLGLEKTGVKTDDRGYIKVNSKLATNVPGIYALGDVKGGPAFTHISYNDYLIVCQNILDGKNLTTRRRPVPYCMFTDPELGRVGITEAEAKEKKLKIKVAKLEMSHVARAIETGHTRGFMKAIVDAETKRILGVAILGEQGGELMSLLEVAMMGNVNYEQLREAIFAHPTLSESINNLFMTLDNQ